MRGFGLEQLLLDVAVVTQVGIVQRIRETQFRFMEIIGQKLDLLVCQTWELVALGNFI